MAINEISLRKFAQNSGIDAIGYFKGGNFQEYLETIKELKEFYNFEYKSFQNFIQAGTIAEKYKTVIVIIKDYFFEKVSDKEELKLSNYTRFCWQTVDPKADRLIELLKTNGYIAEKINTPDRAAACKAGLGFIGKNCMFYAYGLGSYVGIRTIGTNLDLATENLAEERVKNEKCLRCKRCVDSCPTNAIVKEGYRINPLKCISFINRHAEDARKIIPDNILKINNWVHGCEICQDCCQLNKGIVHKMDVTHSESINLYGMKVDNKASIEKNDLKDKMDEIKEPEYKKFINLLLKS